MEMKVAAIFVQNDGRYAEHPKPRLADKLWEKILAGDFSGKRGESFERAAMDFAYSEPSIAPCLILDLDNGVDFNFEGMGLKGNRCDSLQNDQSLATAGAGLPKT